MLTQEQIEARAGAVGGSDQAILIGASPWMTAAELYYLKRGELERDPGDPLLSWLGHQVEPILAQWYELETGWRCRNPGGTVRHRDVDWMIAHPDRLPVVPRGSGDRRGLELKMRVQATGWGPSGSDEIPDDVMLQVQHYMEVTRRPVWDVVAWLLGPCDVRHYTIPRDRSIGDQLVATSGSFMARVRTGRPPPIDYSHATALGLVQQLNPETSTRTVRLPDEAQHWHEVLVAARAERDRLDTVADACRARIEHMMGDAALAFLPDGSSYDRKLRSRGGFTVEPSTYWALNHRKAGRIAT